MSTTNSSAGKQGFSKHCILVPMTDDSSLDVSLQCNENRVSIQSAHGIDVRFHSVVQLDDPSTAQFQPTLAPLIERTKTGENTTVIFGGTRCANVVSKVVAQSASVLLQSNTADMKSCRVTFSWFNIDCEASELLVDVLKAASAITNPTAPIAKSTELFLREAGHGKGTVVPGLLEIEIANDGDLQALLAHLEATVPNIATFTSPGVHTVCQLTFSDLLKKKPSFRKDFVAMGSISDMLDVGRITFIQLSDMVSAGPLPHQAANAPLSPKRPKVGRSKTEPEDVVTKGGYYPWIEHTKTVVQWLESKRASTPFHKSRLMLLLKDVMLRRQKAALLLMLQPSLDQHQANLDWLRLVSLLSRTGPSGGSVGPTSSTAASSAGPATATPVVTSTTTTTTTTTHSNVVKHSMTGTARRTSVTAPSPDAHHSCSPAMSIHKKIAMRRTSTTASAGESTPPVRRASVKTYKPSPQAMSPQMGEPAEGTSPSQSEGGAVNVNTVGTSAPLERRGSRLFRSTAKLLDLPESALQAAAASVPVPEEGQLQKAGSGFTLTKKKSMKKVTSLTPKEISVAMRELSLRNKQAAKVAEMEKTAEELAPFAADTNTNNPEIADLKKRLAAMEDKCRSLEVENVQLIMAAQQQPQQQAQHQSSITEVAAASSEQILSLEEQLRAALERIIALEQLCSAEVELNAALVARHEEEMRRLRTSLSLSASATESKSVTPANEVSEGEPVAAATAVLPSPPAAEAPAETTAAVEASAPVQVQSSESVANEVDDTPHTTEESSERRSFGSSSGSAGSHRTSICL